MKSLNEQYIEDIYDVIPRNNENRKETRAYLLTDGMFFVPSEGKSGKLYESKEKASKDWEIKEGDIWDIWTRR